MQGLDLAYSTGQSAAIEVQNAAGSAFPLCLFNGETESQSGSGLPKGYVVAELGLEVGCSQLPSSYVVWKSTLPPSSFIIAEILVAVLHNEVPGA